MSTAKSSAQAATGLLGLGVNVFLQLLHARARELGVTLKFEQEFSLDDIDGKFGDADLIVASDGLNSKIRNSNLEVFESSIEAPQQICMARNSSNFSRCVYLHLRKN